MPKVRHCTRKRMPTQAPPEFKDKTKNIIVALWMQYNLVVGQKKQSTKQNSVGITPSIAPYTKNIFKN